jgi:hypothetical protein
LHFRSGALCLRKIKLPPPFQGGVGGWLTRRSLFRPYRTNGKSSAFDLLYIHHPNMKNTWFSLFVFIACSSLYVAAAQGQSFDPDHASAFNCVFAGTAGTPVIFKWEWDCIPPNQFQPTTVFWDFGPGATPEKASTAGIYDGVISASFTQDVTYSTAGDKSFTVTWNDSQTATYALHIYDCSVPAIPHDAIVISSDTTVTLGPLIPSRTIWVNPGVTLNLINSYGYDSIFTIFAEPRSTISGAGNCVLYMKHGSVLNSSHSYSWNRVIFGDDASINTAFNDFTLHCPTLDFDYTNAPPNAAHQVAGVVNTLLQSVTISPNPTRGTISIQGAPSNDLNISVMNLLGETVMEQKNPNSANFTLDLSKLVPGVYYIRFSSANLVVTKMVVRE